MKKYLMVLVASCWVLQTPSTKQLELSTLEVPNKITKYLSESVTG